MFGTTQLHRSVAHGSPRGRLLRAAGAAIVAATVLTGCAAGQISQTADMVPNHDGSHGTIGLIGVSNALLGNADENPNPVAFKKGSQVPLSLWVTNDATSPDTLTSISTSAGDVTLSGTATVPQQGALEIGDGADVTATIDSATTDLKYGFPVTVDFYFAHAGKLTLKVPLEVPAERTGDRATTNINPTEAKDLWEESSSANG